MDSFQLSFVSANNPLISYKLAKNPTSQTCLNLDLRCFMNQALVLCRFDGSHCYIISPGLMAAIVT